MKKKFAMSILFQVFESLNDDDRLKADQWDLLKRIFEDVMYGGKIRINHYLKYYGECFEELEFSESEQSKET